MKEVPITGDALSANRLNDVSVALSYAVLKLVGGHLHQYDHLNLFTTFPVLDMNKISQGTAWNNHFIDLFLRIDDLDLEMAQMTVVRSDNSSRTMKNGTGVSLGHGISSSKRALPSSKKQS